jgi:hypothetical protein
MIKKSLKSKTSKSHTWAPLSEQSGFERAINHWVKIVQINGLNFHNNQPVLHLTVGPLPGPYLPVRLVNVLLFNTVLGKLNIIKKRWKVLVKFVSNSLSYSGSRSSSYENEPMHHAAALCIQHTLDCKMLGSQVGAQF